MRLSVHMMVRDGGDVVARAIRSLGKIPGAEVVLVDSLSVDDTVSEAREACSVMGFEFKVVPLPRSMFFDDLQSSFERKLDVPFRGCPLLVDWSAARNAGLDSCRGRYVLKLDADDVCLEPQKLLAALDVMDAERDNVVVPRISMLACPYDVCRPAEEVRVGEAVVDYTVGYTRIWRNSPRVRFRGVCHENVDYLRAGLGSSYVNAADGPRFADLRDSYEREIRPACAYFKTLLREYEKVVGAGGTPDPHHLLYLAEEAATARPDVAHAALDVLSTGEAIMKRNPKDRAWIHFTRGRAHEQLGEDEVAIDAYDLATGYGHVRAALYAAVLRCRGSLSRSLRLCEIVRTNKRCAHQYPMAASAGEVARAQDPDCCSLVRQWQRDWVGQAGDRRVRGSADIQYEHPPLEDLLRTKV